MARNRDSDNDIFRRVSVRMHGDEKVRALSRPPPNGETLWFHLLTGEQTGIIPGLCKVGEAAFAEQLEWPVEGFRKAFAEVSAQGLVKADWKARVVWVPKALKHNKPASPNVLIHWRRAWELLPECELKDEAWSAFKAFFEEMGKPWLEAFVKACPKPWRNQVAGSREQVAVEEAKALSPATPTTAPGLDDDDAAQGEPEQPKLVDLPPDDVTQVFEHWRRVMGITAAAKLDDKRRRMIRIRLKQWKLAQLLRCIDGYRLDPFTMGENDRATKYNSLERILSDSESIERGLGFADHPPRAGGTRTQTSRPGLAVPAVNEPEIFAEQAAREERERRELQEHQRSRGAHP